MQYWTVMSCLNGIHSRQFYELLDPYPNVCLSCLFVTLGNMFFLKEVNSVTLRVVILLYGLVVTI